MATVVAKAAPTPNHHHHYPLLGNTIKHKTQSGPAIPFPQGRLSMYNAIPGNKFSLFYSQAIIIPSTT